MYVAKRYFFPPMLKIVSPPTESACGYVLRTSTRLVHRNRFAVRNQSSSGVSASLCVSANSRRALRLMTRTNTYSQNESTLSTVRCQPLLVSSSGQIQAQVPDTLPAGTHVVEVRSLSTAQASDPVVVTARRGGGGGAGGGGVGVGGGGWGRRGGGTGLIGARA